MPESQDESPPAYSSPAPSTRHQRDPAQRALVPIRPQAMQLAEVVPASAQQVNGRRRGALAPNPGQSYRRNRRSGGGLIALQPMTIVAFLRDPRDAELVRLVERVVAH